MARRPSLALVVASCGALCSGCGVKVGGNPAEDAGADGRPGDAAIDARPCTGGDQSMTAPDGSCFVFIAAAVTFAEAQAACTALNAHLAIVNTAALDDAAEAFVGTHDTYIGLTDQAVENTFVWVDGSALVFSAWEPNEPSNGGGAYEEDCAIIAGSRLAKKWDDRPCAPVANVGGGNYSTLCQF
jgi:lectin-like protein